MTSRAGVAITHASEDGKWAEAISGALAAAGMDVRQVATVDSESEWTDFRQALDRVSTILVIVSANAAASKSLPFQAGAVLGGSSDSATRLVPVYLSSRGPDYMPLLRGLEGIDLSGLRPEQGAQRVVEFLQPTAE